MPPDRTSSTFSPVPSSSQSVYSQQAKDKASSIARGLACLACRKRKVKCDSIKPVCTGCIKYAKGDDESISCVYDDATAPKKKRSSPGTVAALEASNQALKDELEELKSHIARMQSNDFAANCRLSPDFQGSSFRMSFAPPAAGNIEGESLSRQHGASTPGSPRGYRTDSITPCVPQDPRGSAFSAALEMDVASGGGATTFRQVATELGPTPPDSPDADFWNQLIYPGWPKDLPSFELTSRLLEVWFSKPHCLTGLIKPSTFRASMLHPPSTSGFPHSALIHAMMAIASLLVSDDFFANEPRYWPLDQKVTEYHAARAKVALDQAIAHGQRLLQASQAVTILCYWAYTCARFVELWLLCGMAGRIITPLGLNQLAAPPDPNRLKMHLLPPPKDDDELYERSINCWYAFMSDRAASACTGWAHSLDEADVVSLLPTEAPSELAGDFESSPLSPRSPSFFLAHPPHLVGPKQLELKAIILLGRVNTFVQRAPLASQRDPSGLNSTVPDIRTSEAFRKLETDIVGFQASIPREYQSTGAATSDPRLHIVQSLPAAVMILLHERFVTLRPDDPSAAITMRHAQKIMQGLHSLVSTSFEIGLLSPFINYVWVVTGRNLVREIAVRMTRNVRDGIDQLRGDVQTILLALHACKTPLALSTATQLQTLLDDPYRALPAAGPFGYRPTTQSGPTYGNDPTRVSRGEAFNDVPDLLRSAYSSYPGSEFASVNTSSGSSVSSSSYKPYTPPLSSISDPSTSSTSHHDHAEAGKTLQEIDETLSKNGFFATLGDNSFGPEIDALIHGSRASAPWLASGNIVPPPLTTTTTATSFSTASVTAYSAAMVGDVSMGTARFEELDSHDLMRMGSLSSIFGTSEK